jgi:hypothetical protein
MVSMSLGTRSGENGDARISLTSALLPGQWDNQRMKSPKRTKSRRSHHGSSSVTTGRKLDGIMVMIVGNVVVN